MSNLALKLIAPARLEVVAVAARPLRGDEARVRVEAAGICGSDIHGFSGHNDRRPVGVVMGHETVGRITEGERPELDLVVGARVVVNPIVACGSCQACRRKQENLCDARRLFGCAPELPGGLATEIIVPITNLVPVDGELDVRGLVLAEPFAVGQHAVRISGVAASDRVLVIGGGAIGFAVAIALRARVERVVVCEPAADRRTLLEGFGFATCDPEEVGGAGPYDAAFECVGWDTTFRAAIDAVRTGGTVIALGIADPVLTMPAAELVIGERRLLGSSAYTMEDFVRSIEQVSVLAESLAPLVDAVPTLEGMAAAFAQYRDGTRSAFKTALIPPLDLDDGPDHRQTGTGFDER
jgi:threonine dehydrogenase-like Zn-dependent dehydrogenase